MARRDGSLQGPQGIPIRFWDPHVDAGVDQSIKSLGSSSDRARLSLLETTELTATVSSSNLNTSPRTERADQTSTMCGPSIQRNNEPGTTMAVVFRNHLSVGCIYLRHTASGEAVIMNPMTLSEAEKPLFASDDHALNVRIHKYGTHSVASNNPVLHRFPLLSRQCKISCDSNSMLSVSEDGVVGRGLSIVDVDGTCFGIGITGWN